MISEVIFLYIIRAIITILGILEAKIMLKYFDQKALGMQTIFDQMIKDKLYLSLLTCTCIIIVDIILEISESVNELIATRVIFLFQLCALMELWQSIVINVIRSQCSKIWKKRKILLGFFLKNWNHSIKQPITKASTTDF